MKRKVFAISFAMLAMLLISVAVVSVRAATGDLKGWGWGGSDNGAGISAGAGWISMASTNCDTNADGVSEGALGCPPAGTAMAQYKVNVPINDGNVSGYAWSSNLGWIAFDNSGGYLNSCPFPDVTHGCNAYREGNALKGWARITGIADTITTGNNGGNQGWVKLNDSTGGNKYGTTIDAARNINGYAWSDELGYFKLTGTNISCTPVCSVQNAANICIGQTGGGEADSCGGLCPVVNGTKDNASCCNIFNFCNTTTMSTPTSVTPTGLNNLCDTVNYPGVVANPDPAQPDAVGGNWTWTCSKKPQGYTLTTCTYNCSAARTFNLQFGNWKEVAP